MQTYDSTFISPHFLLFLVCCLVYFFVFYFFFFVCFLFSFSFSLFLSWFRFVFVSDIFGVVFVCFFFVSFCLVAIFFFFQGLFLCVCFFFFFFAFFYRGGGGGGGGMVFLSFFQPQLYEVLYCIFFRFSFCFFCCCSFYILFPLFFLGGGGLFVCLVSLFFFFFLQFLLIFWSVFIFFLFSLLGFYFFYCFAFVLFEIISAFGGCCFTLEADWVFSSRFCSLNLSCKQTYVSWRFGRVVPDDVIADIGDQALDIFLHGPESTNKNGILKTFTHTSIPIQPCTLLKQRAKPSTHQTWRLRLVTLFLSSVVVDDGQEAWQMLLSTAPKSDAFWRSRTVLTENICRWVQQIIEHRPAIMPFLTNSTITLSCLASAAPDSWRLGHVEPDDVVIADIGGQALDIFLHAPESAHKNGIVKTFTHTSIPIQPCTLLKTTTTSTHQTCLRLLVLFLSSVLVGEVQEVWQMLLRTAPRRRPSRLGQYWQKTFIDVLNKYSNLP